jgi:hypothetical protein
LHKTTTIQCSMESSLCTFQPWAAVGSASATIGYSVATQSSVSSCSEIGVNGSICSRQVCTGQRADAVLSMRQREALWFPRCRIDPGQ